MYVPRRKETTLQCRIISHGKEHSQNDTSVYPVHSIVRASPTGGQGGATTLCDLHQEMYLLGLNHLEVKYGITEITENNVLGTAASGQQKTSRM